MRLYLSLLICLVVFISCNSRRNKRSSSRTIGSTHSSISFNLCSNKQQIYFHEYFALSYDEKSEQADWVAYIITKNSFTKNTERTNDYRVDNMISTKSAHPEDYVGSGYDRGHLAPAGSMKMNEISMSESFLMSNISPQLPGFNRGIWRRLEEKIRYWSDSFDSLLVITGPILSEPIKTIGINNVAVPRAFFKTIVGYRSNTTTGIAFLLPHEESDKAIYSFATSIDSIEKIKDIDFYCNLPRAQQETSESNSSLRDFLFPK